MLKVTATAVGSPRAVAAQFKRDMREELLTVGRQWHTRYFPLHFEFSATGRYRYQARKPNYEKGKARRKGHRRPLVYSGALERLTRAAANVTSTPKGVRVALRGPRYLYAYHKNAAQPNKAAELTATTAAEERTLSASLDFGMTRRMQRNTVRENLSRGQTGSGRYIIGNL